MSSGMESYRWLIPVAIPILVSWFFSPKRRAKKLLRQTKEMYSNAAYYVEVSPRDYKWVDHAWYEDSTDRFRTAGFRHLGDIESLSTSRIYPNQRHFTRCLVGMNGIALAGIAHVKMRGSWAFRATLGLMPMHMRCLDLETELVDGTFIVTNNLSGLNRMQSSPHLDRVQLAPNTNIKELIKTHRERVDSITAERQIPAVCVSTLQEVLDSQERLHRLNAEYRRSVGYVTGKEFEAIAGKKLKSAQRSFVTEFERLRDKESQSAGDTIGEERQRSLL